MQAILKAVDNETLLSDFFKKVEKKNIKRVKATINKKFRDKSSVVSSWFVSNQADYFTLQYLYSIADHFIASVAIGKVSLNNKNQVEKWLDNKKYAIEIASILNTTP